MRYEQLLAAIYWWGNRDQQSFPRSQNKLEEGTAKIRLQAMLLTTGQYCFPQTSTAKEALQAPLPADLCNLVFLCALL